MDIVSPSCPRRAYQQSLQRRQSFVSLETLEYLVVVSLNHQDDDQLRRDSILYDRGHSV